MFRGIYTQTIYESCLKKGFCKEHSIEICQNESDSQNNNELSRKALLFIRISILDPILFKRPGKCDKMRFLMQKTSYFSHSFGGMNVADEAYEAIFILDSVIIFTLCHLSKICCIGALFQFNSITLSHDPEIKYLQNLLHTDRLKESDISRLNPLLQENFDGFDMDLVKVCYASTLLFVRHACIQQNIKTAVETLEKDLLIKSDLEHFKSVAEVAYQDEKFEDALNSYTAALMQNSYCADLLTLRAQAYIKLRKFKAAQLDGYTALIINPFWCEGYCKLASSFFHQKMFKEALEVSAYGLNLCNSSEFSSYEALESIKIESEMKFLNIGKTELSNNASKISVNHNDSSRKEPERIDSFPELIDCSDSGESDSDVSRPLSNSFPELIEASDSDSDIVEETPVLSTPTKHKRSKKRTQSEVLPDVRTEDHMDTAKINSFLKEASQALLEECGYKAIQIFRGPLRDIIENPLLTGFEECDIVCMKYAYGLGYCKSGGYDDLQKCTVIFKDIIGNHDSVAFPAAYYALGLAYRKLNRFKDALNYLEPVQSILDKGIHCKVYPWPGLTSVIKETKMELLKDLVAVLIKECENPPNPDAFCRYAECSFQPPIYYSDPDFKGYISLFCSEQCCLQYHLQCWKCMKGEKNLTDKDFLEEPCFTPDCDGLIAKIQSVDKKGDVNKEFIADIKKGANKRWAKGEKKTDAKEKKKKKASVKADTITQDNPNECERSSSRKSSDANDGSQSSLESSVSSSVERNLPNHGNSIQTQKFEETTASFSSCTDSIRDSDIYSSTMLRALNGQDISENKSETSLTTTFDESSKFQVSKCITNNIYSFMADFLQEHGPLKMDDRSLMAQMSTFPEDVELMIAECGGIGEFLKNDLRFAYVGDTYVCVVADVVTAYKMLNSSSLPSDAKSLHSFGSSDHSKYYECSNDNSTPNSGLNPDAMEYKPSSSSVQNNKNTNYQFINNYSLSQNSNNKFSSTYEHIPKLGIDALNNQNINQLCELSENVAYPNKSKSLEATLDKNSSSTSISLQTDSLINFGKKCDFKPVSSVNNQYLEKKDPLCSSYRDTLDYRSKNKEMSENLTPGDLDVMAIQVKLLDLIILYYSKIARSSHPSADLHLGPYIIKRAKKTMSTGTGTDMEYPGSESADMEAARQSAEVLKDRNDVLTEQKSLLQKQLQSTCKLKQELATEVSQLKQTLTNTISDFKSLKKESFQKEEQLRSEESGRTFLVESLTKAHETIDKQKKEMDSLRSQKDSVNKNMEELRSSFKIGEETLKKCFDLQEKEHTTMVQSLRKDILELKSRVKFADLQVLYLKKAQYLKKIEERSLEASNKRKEMTDGLSIMSVNLPPVMNSSMKTLSTQLSTYVNDLCAIKRDFMLKIDEQIEKIRNGASLAELKEVEMKDLPEIPCWRNPFPTNSSTFENYPFGSNQIPFHFLNSGNFASNGSSAPVIPPVSAPAPVISAVPPPVELNKLQTENSESLDILNLNPDLKESFKTAMASINSFASAPLSNSVPSLDEDPFDKNFAVFEPSASGSNTQLDPPKMPPGIQTSLTSSSSSLASMPSEKVTPPQESQPFGGLDSIPKVPVEQEKPYAAVAGATATAATAAPKNNYEKLLKKLQEQFPSYTQEELISYVKEFRIQRQGKLSGLPIDSIISQVGAIIISKRKAKENSKKIADKRIDRLVGAEWYGVSPQYDPKPYEKTKLFVGSLPFDCTNEDLYKLFSKYGTVIECDVINKYGFVHMSSPDEAEAALLGVNNYYLRGSYLSVEFSESRVQPKTSKVLVNKRLVPDPKPKEMPSEQPVIRKKSAWGIVESDSTRQWSGNCDESCVICYEDMISGSEYKVACGHMFHENCIRQWLKKKSDCPICRVLLLLPEDYPSLS